MSFLIVALLHGERLPRHGNEDIGGPSMPRDFSRSDLALVTTGLTVVAKASARPDAVLLFARFDDARVDCRFAAAKALGMMCDGDVRAQLCQMVRANFHRREALAALLCCGDVDAASFLEAARANPSLNAQLRSVRGELNRLF